MNVSAEQIYEYILAFQRVYPGVSPSFRDIMNAFRISSTSVVANLIADLRHDRQLETYSENVRGIVLTNTALLHKDELEQMGIDWVKIELMRNQSKRELINGTVNGNGRRSS